MKELRGRILVVEDDPADALLIKRRLQSMGLGVEWVSTIEAAKRRLRVDADDGLDAVLLDMHVPPFMGEEGLLALRNVHASIPILIMTGAELSELTVRRLVRLGASDILFKGVEEESLRRRLGVQLHRARLMRTEPGVIHRRLCLMMGLTG